MKRIWIIVISTIVIGMFLTQHSSSQQQPLQQRPPRQIKREPYLSVVDFGAVPNDNRWDSDAIQRAIDSLPRAGADGNTPTGGVVVLPAGKYMLNKPLRIFNGVILRGEGAATVLHTGGDFPAILLTSPFEYHYCISAGVEDLSIYTEKSPGIAAAPDVTNILQTRFVNLTISAGACALDLNPGLANKTWMQNTIIRNVRVFRYGGPALTLWGNQNHIEQLVVEGGTRPNFKAEPAIITISGDSNDIRSCLVGDNLPDTSAVAFCLSGNFTWSHNWIELNPRKSGVAYIFKDVEQGQIDQLLYCIPSHKARFINCTSIQIRELNINGDWTTLEANLELDESSSVRIDQVIARMDAGMLDDPRLSIGSVYNKKGKYRVVLPLRGNPISVMPSPSARNSGAWQARWDAAQGRITGSMRFDDQSETASKRMRVQITENPNKQQLWIEVPLPVTDELLGRRCIATWRIDGTPQSVVLHNDQEIPSRAMNSLTANPLPQPLKKGDKLMFILPPEPGEYFISDVALYPQ